jgi:thiol-disulfide isomerase/thioredoxin
MKQILLVLVLLILFVNQAISQNNLLADSTKTKHVIRVTEFDATNQYFKRFSFFSIDSNYYSDDSLKNKITIINFWFEACAPCIAEFDALNKLYDRFKSNKNFQFLSFTFEEKQEASKIADRSKLRYPIICVIRNAIYKLIFNLGFPTTIITDKTGQIKFIKSGGQENEKAANKEVDSLYSKKIEKPIIRKLIS